MKKARTAKNKKSINYEKYTLIRIFSPFQNERFPVKIMSFQAKKEERRRKLKKSSLTMLQNRYMGTFRQFAVICESHGGFETFLRGVQLNASNEETNII